MFENHKHTAWMFNLGKYLRSDDKFIDIIKYAYREKYMLDTIKFKKLQRKIINKQTPLKVIVPTIEHIIIKESVTDTEDLFSLNFNNALHPDMRCEGTNGTGYVADNELYKDNINKYGCNKMIVSSLSSLSNISNMQFIYNDTEHLNTTKCLHDVYDMGYTFQNYNILEFTPSTCKKINELLFLSNYPHTACVRGQIYKKIEENIEDNIPSVIYYDGWNFSKVRTIITLYKNACQNARLYVCYIVDDMKQPDYHIIHEIMPMLQEYKDNINLVSFPYRYKNFEYVYISEKQFVFYYKSKKNYMMFYGLDLVFNQ